MNLLCGFFQNLWNEFYQSCIVDVEPKTKGAIGLGLVILGIITFIYSTQKSKKGEMIGRWWLFWISSILFVCGVIYLKM